MIRRFENGDIATSGLQFLEGAEATAQAVYHRLRLFLGEYFLNVDRGTPWYQLILGKAPLDAAEIALKRQITTTQGVAGIQDFDLTTDRVNRSLTVTTTIVHTSGQTATVVVEGEI